jgi:hypothetical protein
MDFSLNFTTRGKSLDELKRRINGETSLRGENLLLYSFDPDSLLLKIEGNSSINRGSHFHYELGHNLFC